MDEVTLVCVCTDATRCHRTVLAGLLGKMGGMVKGERPVAPQRVAIVCQRGRGGKGCQKVQLCHCGAPVEALCDFELSEGKTCDAGRCRNHSVIIGPDRDYCDEHAALLHDFKTGLAAQGR